MSIQLARDVKNKFDEMNLVSCDFDYVLLLNDANRQASQILQKHA